MSDNNNKKNKKVKYPKKSTLNFKENEKKKKLNKRNWSDYLNDTSENYKISNVNNTDKEEEYNNIEFKDKQLSNIKILNNNDTLPNIKSEILSNSKKENCNQRKKIKI